jgi:hypothetical protein
MNTPVSFPIAKLLKEKGFDESTESNWWILAKDHSENYNKKLPVDESKIFFTKNSYELELKTQIDENTEHNFYHVLKAPTIAEVVMWLYEKHGIWISIDWMTRTNPYDSGFYCHLRGTNKSLNQDNFIVINDTLDPGYEIFNSPTEAYEAAILYTLNNLI